MRGRYAYVRVSVYLQGRARECTCVRAQAGKKASRQEMHASMLALHACIACLHCMFAYVQVVEGMRAARCEGLGMVRHSHTSAGMRQRSIHLRA
jgi:hypothetical protein